MQINLVQYIKQYLKSFARPDSFIEDGQADNIDRDLELEKLDEERRKIAARLRILELQARHRKS